MTSEQTALYKAIDEILWNYWDPIGVKDSENARDEYDFYIPKIYSLKNSGASEVEIAQMLLKFETDRMGLLGDKENCKLAAQKIIELSI